MAKSITERQKRRGRPPTGLTPSVTLRLPASLLTAIDKWGRDHDTVSRTEAIRRLLEKALADENSTKRKPR
jgi:metal-responsive CopG/Arc/MetJ family transcriptional regulator